MYPYNSDFEGVDPATTVLLINLLGLLIVCAALSL